jgi:hypothetical protein
LATSLIDAGLELEILFSRLIGDRVASGYTVFDIEIRRFADVPYDLITSIALGYTAGEGRNCGDVPAIRFLLEDDRIALGVWHLILIIPANTPVASRLGAPRDVTGNLPAEIVLAPKPIVAAQRNRANQYLEALFSR